MPIVSPRLEKSGTGWRAEVLCDLPVAGGHGDSRALGDRYGLGDAAEGAHGNGRPQGELVRRVRAVVPRANVRTRAQEPMRAKPQAHG